jgi:hypothetical protein
MYVIDNRTAFCNVGRTGTHVITEVKQRWARLRPGKASEKTPRGVILPVCVTQIALKKKNYFFTSYSPFRILTLYTAVTLGSPGK